MANTKLAALSRRGNKKLVTIRMDNNHDASVVFNAHITDHTDAAEPTATYAVSTATADSPGMEGRDISRFYRTIVIQTPAGTHPVVQPQVTIDGTNWIDAPVGWSNQGMAANATTEMAIDVSEILALSLPAPGVRVRLNSTLPAGSDFIITVMLTDSSEKADIGRA